MIMELTRPEAIDILEKLLSHMMLYRGGIKPSEQEKEALNYAISSLKTDETYQLMYEGEEIFTKDDLVNLLKNLQSEIEKIQSVPCDYHGDWCVDRDKVWEIIQQKINVLRGQEDGDNK